MKLNLGEIIKFSRSIILLWNEYALPNRVWERETDIYNENKLMSESETTDLRWIKLKIVTLLLPIMMFANSDFTYSISTNNPNPYLKEATIVTIDINQTNHNSVMFFKFFVTKMSYYKSEQINLQESNTYHNTNQRYTYLIYPLSIGDIDIEFNLTQKLTTDDSVAYSFSGDRDNVKGLVTQDTPIKLPNLKLQVKPLPKDTQLVGDFKLDYSLSTHTAQAYEPIPLNIEITGRGYLPILDNILPKDREFTQFLSPPIIESHIVDEDTQSTIKYSNALSHYKDFTLDRIELKAFDPKTNKSYTLTIPKQEFNIIEANSSKLIDKIDSPPPLEMEYSYILDKIGYILAYISGLLSGLMILFLRKY